MAIIESNYDSEKELQDWVFSNINEFLACSNLLAGFRITTASGKNGVPDGFAFDFENREWYVIECELLSHGVWPHIAEQITRFVVALQNPETLRKIRDRIFEKIMGDKKANEIADSLNIAPERLHQQVETFIEGVRPNLVIFIDETNQDLKDMVQALNIQSNVFRIKKFMVNGKAEYHCPDVNKPALVSEPIETEKSTEYDIIELLGGGKIESTAGRFKCYKLQDGSVVYIKNSKYYEKNDYYWYATTPQSLEYIKNYGVTHMVFVMANFGFAKVPISTVQEFLKDTGVSKNPDGSVKHYHLLVNNKPEPELFYSNDRPKYSLAEYFQTFE